MNETLLFSERAILESLHRSEKNINLLWQDLQLDPRYLMPLLQYLLIKGYILYEKTIYKLNPINQHLWDPKLIPANEFKSEIKDLLNWAMDDYFSRQENKSFLKLKKVWMTQGELTIFNSLIKNVEIYVDNLISDRIKYPQKYENELLAEKKIIYWGASDYRDVLKSSLACV
jgi:hypothetical protein